MWYRVFFMWGAYTRTYWPKSKLSSPRDHADVDIILTPLLLLRWKRWCPIWRINITKVVLPIVLTVPLSIMFRSFHTFFMYTIRTKCRNFCVNHFLMRPQPLLFIQPVQLKKAVEKINQNVPIATRAAKINR